MEKYKSFRDALADGKNAEIRVITLLRDAGATITDAMLDGARADFACIHRGTRHLVEVKCEDNYQYPKTNLCIEMYQHQPPEPSGILVSRATVCIHTFGPKLAIYLREQMKEWAEAEVASGRSLRNMGDNNNQALIENRAWLCNHHWWFDYVTDKELAVNNLWMSNAQAHIKPKTLFG